MDFAFRADVRVLRAGFACAIGLAAKDGCIAFVGWGAFGVFAVRPGILRERAGDGGSAFPAKTIIV